MVGFTVTLKRPIFITADNTHVIEAKNDQAITTGPYNVVKCSNVPFVLYLGGKTTVS